MRKEPQVLATSVHLDGVTRGTTCLRPVRRRSSSHVFLMLRRLDYNPRAAVRDSRQFQARPVASTSVFSSGNGPSLGAVLPPRRIQAASVPKHGRMYLSCVYG
jgi:hypothetical protein